MKLIKEIIIKDTPCSVNSIWRTYRNIQTKSKKAKEFESYFKYVELDEKIDYEIVIDIKLYFNRYKTRDVDNYIKNILDGLQNGQLIENDNLVKKVIAEKIEVKKNIDCKTVIKIYKYIDN